MLQKNPLKKFEKKSFWLNTDMYVDKAINAIIDSDKIILEAGKSISDAMTMRVIAVDQLENIMIGLGMVEKGIDPETEKPTAYQLALDKAEAALEKKKPKDELQSRVKMANFRFQVLLNALKKNKPTSVEFKG